MAHGIRLALNATVPIGTLQEREIGAVHDALDLFVYAEARIARAEYIAAKIEYDMLTGAGLMNDAAGDLPANLAAATNRAREAKAIEQEGGTLRHLRDNERPDLQRFAGTAAATRLPTPTDPIPTHQAEALSARD